MRWTGYDSAAWFATIATYIVKTAKPIRGSKGLSTNDPSEWIYGVARLLWKKTLPNCPPGVDPNIMAAHIMGILLIHWTASIIRAKSHDPRRPLDVRKRMLGGVINEIGTELLTCLLDGSRDPEYFPAQEWNSPYGPNARYEPDEMELKRQEFTKKATKKQKGKK